MDLVTATGILVLSLLILGPRIAVLVALVVAITLAYQHELPVKKLAPVQSEAVPGARQNPR